ncbi:tripartite motif-containing protein 16-like [Brachyhypopomus gauderio]|uniref:tripartite motif-containing protein 16-like n=1 Tax=Brachyhypopomus gauderio TaxID=698409 RepID=UPI004041A0A1
MAEASFSADQDDFKCPICLHLLKDPVTSPCGHNFCMDCLNGYWDQEQQQVYFCPQCRETFNPRPALRRNNMLSELLLTLQNTDAKDSFSTFLDVSLSSNQDVECDSCIGEKKRAVKSCLTCLASYCDTHVLPHHEAAAFKKHKLVSVVANLQGKTCAQHNKILDCFCRTDQRAICYECLISNHKAHDTTSVEAEWREKKKHFGELQLKQQDTLKKRETTLLELKCLMEHFKNSAQAAVEDNEKNFTELIHSMENRRSDLTALIRAQEKTELDRAAKVQEQLEQETLKLQRKGTSLEQLSHTNDYVHFLQCFQFMKSDLETGDKFKVTFNQQWQFEDFKTSVSQLKEDVEDLCKEKWEIISKNVTIGQIVPVPEPETREEFLKYSCELSLDPNTINHYLRLSNDNTQVTCSGQHASYPDHPERFTHWQQVLSKHRLPQRSYWEVEVGGGNGVSIAVSYKEIQRKGCDGWSRFGHNSKSWRLVCYPEKYSFWHQDVQVAISGPTAKRIGVYLDQKLGNLSFYSVSNRMTLIHKVTSTFTVPLYVGFGLGHGSHAKICLQVQAGVGGAAAKDLKK